MSKRSLSTNIMSGAHNGRTTLLDLPEELLRSCMPWHDSNSIRVCGAVCKRLLEVLLMGNSSGRLGLSLQIQEPQHVHDKRASLLLALQFFPNLQKLKVLSKGLLRNHLAHLLAVPQGSYQLGADWLYGITHMHLGNISTQYNDRHVLLPHPVPSHVAKACPNLKELTLRGITFSEQDQWEVDRHYREQHTHWAQCMDILKRMEEDCGRLQQLSEQLARGGEGSDSPAAARQWVAVPQCMPLYEHIVQQQTELLMQAPQGQYGDKPAPLAGLPHLQKLSMHNCHWETSTSAFQQQLQLLPSLQELVTSDFSLVVDHTTLREGCAAAIADGCSRQLVRLEWKGCAPQEITALLSKPWAQLHWLQAPNSTVDDIIMELLLQHTPSLKTIHVGRIELQHDFSHRPCCWETVIMQHSVNIASLPRLPLSTVTELCVGRNIVVRIGSTEGGAAIDESYLNATVAAAALAVACCGGIQQVKGQPPGALTIGLVSDQQCYVGKVAMAVLPLLGRIIGFLSFTGVHVTRDLLHTICTHMPHCHSAGFDQGCTFEPGIWRSMVSLLPNVTFLRVWLEHATLHQLKALCAAADHPVILEVVGSHFNQPDHIGWQDELQESAMGRPVDFEFS